MELGAEGTATCVCAEANTARAMGSGSLDVFATPAMVALIEKAACNSLLLPDGSTSVGTAVCVQHLAASQYRTGSWPVRHRDASQCRAGS